MAHADYMNIIPTSSRIQPIPRLNSEPNNEVRASSSILRFVDSIRNKVKDPLFFVVVTWLIMALLLWMETRR